MPIYAFECDACGHNFERLQKLSDADPTDCPQCHAARVRRQLTAPQFRLAGGGWYETDFKKDGDKKRNLAGDGGSGGGETKSDGKSDGKSSDSKPSEGKSGDSKSGDSKSTDSKAGGSSGDGKSSDGKAASKPVESKPAAPAKSDGKPAA